jgi:hypothetical protein
VTLVFGGMSSVSNSSELGDLVFICTDVVSSGDDVRNGECRRRKASLRVGLSLCTVKTVNVQTLVPNIQRELMLRFGAKLPRGGKFSPLHKPNLYCLDIDLGFLAMR